MLGSAAIDDVVGWLLLGSVSLIVAGVCMNTRALMELIAINIGYDMGVLPRDMFTKLMRSEK